MAKLKKCKKHDHCYEPCKSCKHCDTKFHPSCRCSKCECNKAGYKTWENTR